MEEWTRDALEALTRGDLANIAKDNGLVRSGMSRWRKGEFVEALLELRGAGAGRTKQSNTPVISCSEKSSDNAKASVSSPNNVEPTNPELRKRETAAQVPLAAQPQSLDRPATSSASNRPVGRRGRPARVELASEDELAPGLGQPELTRLGSPGLEANQDAPRVGLAVEGNNSKARQAGREDRRGEVRDQRNEFRDKAHDGRRPDRRGERGDIRRDDWRDDRVDYRGQRSDERGDYRNDERGDEGAEDRREVRRPGRRDERQDSRRGERGDYRQDSRRGERQDSRRDYRQDERQDRGRDERFEGRRDYRQDDSRDSGDERLEVRSEERQDRGREGRRDSRRDNRRDQRDLRDSRRDDRRDERRDGRRDEGREVSREDSRDGRRERLDEESGEERRGYARRSERFSEGKVGGYVEGDGYLDREKVLAPVGEDGEPLDAGPDEAAEPEAVEPGEVDNNVVFVTGVLDVLPDGFGFLRGRTYKPEASDVFVPAPMIKRHSLRVGDMVTGIIRSPKHGENFCGLAQVVSVNGMEPEQAVRRPMFDHLTPVFPDSQYLLETDSKDMSGRIIDIFAPIGKGQRGLIVSPPKAGKTILLKKIAAGIAANFPEALLFALLVDERPEEVTDMDRSIQGEVIASTFDEAPEQHIRISQLVMERARRLVELGKDVVVLLDSLTRMGRACNNTTPPSGRTLSGGLDIAALRMPKRFFGSARNVENGGSLTIIATALIDTGSKMDEVIFEEFKGTGNMEIDLSRRLAERRIFPAIDIKKSGTRHDECLMNEQALEVMTKLRRALDALSGEQDPTEVILGKMKLTRSNVDFLNTLWQKS